MNAHCKVSEKSQNYISLVNQYAAKNYKPLDVVLTHGKNEWVWDIDGKKYLDMLSAYSAVSLGHCHPEMQKTLLEQSQKMTLQSRVFHSDQLGPWTKEITEVCKMEKVIPMNTGAEAVETAIKLARKWAYTVKNVPRGKANIIVCDQNFHGRTTTIVGFSSEKSNKEDFGPHDNSFISIPFGDSDALERAITPNTAAFLFEAVQGEGGIILPPEGYLTKVSEICKKHNVLCVVDEVQTGFARTGKLFAHWNEEGCKPDLMILGKALGGAYYPISAVVGSAAVLDVFVPGDHGSTFGGNPLACALSRTAVDLIVKGGFSERATKLGEKFRAKLQNLPTHIVHEVRGCGLLNAIEIKKEAGDGRFYVELLADMGLLSKETHSHTLRFAPPLTIEESSLDLALEILQKAFSKTQSEWEHEAAQSPESANDVDENLLTNSPNTPSVSA